MSEMTLSQAAAEAGKFGNFVRAFAKIAETAETLVALEQNIGERKKELERVGQEVAAANDRLAAAKSESEAVEARAKADAASILAQARDHAHGKANDAASLVMSANAERDAARRATADAKAELASVQEAIAARSKELAGINERIEAAREAARKLIGG